MEQCRCPKCGGWCFHYYSNGPDQFVECIQCGETGAVQKSDFAHAVGDEP